MLPINNFYTGQGTEMIVPDLGKTEAAAISAQEKQQEMMKIKFNEALRQRKELLEAGDVDVVDLMVEKMTKMQSEKISEFENDIKKRYADRKGVLSDPDLIDIKSKSNQLRSWQNNVMSSQQAYLKDEAEFRKNPYDYDADAWNDARAGFYETGRYTPGLQLAPIDADAIIVKSIKAGGAFQTISDETRTTVNNVTDVRRMQGYKVTPENVAELSDRHLSLHPGYQSQRIKEYLELPESERERYVQMSEGTGDNPIQLYDRDRIENVSRKLGGVMFKGSTDDDYGGKGSTYAFGNVGESPQFTDIKNQEGITVYTGDVEHDPVPISKTSVLEASDGLDVRQLPSSMRAVPAFITENYVEWQIDNASKDVKVYDVDASGGVTKYFPDDGYTGLWAAKKDKEPHTHTERLTSPTGDRYYQVYKTPPKIFIKTPLTGFEQSIKLFVPDIESAFPNRVKTAPASKYVYIDGRLVK